MMNVVGVIAVMSFVGIGIIQTLAVWESLTAWFGLSWILAVAITGLVGWVPVVGGMIGGIGALYVWDWQALLLMLGQPLLLLTTLGLVSAGSRLHEHLRSKN